MAGVRVESPDSRSPSTPSRAWTCPGKKFPGSLSMRILAITNIYPSPAFPARGVFVQEQVKGLCAIGLNVRVLFVDRQAEGPAAYYRLRSKVSPAGPRVEPDAIHRLYG